MSRFVYNVNLDYIDKITGVYLYHGNEHQNGTVVIDLPKEAKEVKIDDTNLIKVTRDGEIEGTLVIASITSDDLQRPLKGKSLSHL